MIFGIAGAIGSGKSFIQLHQALYYANEREKQLVCNFHLNLRELYKYSKMAKLKWIEKLCLEGGIIMIPAPKYFEALFIPDSVVCLDEAGIFLNSRDFSTTSRQLLADLAQSRKDGCDLFWCAQFEAQVDYQIRLLTQYWIHCDSLSTYDKKLKRPRMLLKRAFWFRAAEYMNWISNKKDYGSYFKARFAYGFKIIEGPLSASDKQLFNVFDSFARLDDVSYNSEEIQYKRRFDIVTLQRCDLPRLYYIDKLGRDYHPFKDPLSKHYLPLYGYWLKKSDRSFAFASTTPTSSYASPIKKALEICRLKKIKPPYFKGMSDAEVRTFIRQHSN